MEKSLIKHGNSLAIVIDISFLILQDVLFAHQDQIARYGGDQLGDTVCSQTVAVKPHGGSVKISLHGLWPPRVAKQPGPPSKQLGPPSSFSQSVVLPLINRPPDRTL